MFVQHDLPVNIGRSPTHREHLIADNYDTPACDSSQRQPHYVNKENKNQNPNQAEIRSTHLEHCRHLI